MRSHLLTLLRRRASGDPALTAAAAAQLFAGWEMGPSWCFKDAAATQPCAQGDACAALKNRYGAATYLLTQATAADRPLLQKDSNNCWYLDFDGVNDFLAYPALPLPNAGITLGVVASLATAGNFPMFVTYFPGGVYELRGNGSTAKLEFNGVVATNALTVGTTPYALTGRSSATAADVRVNGAQAHAPGAGAAPYAPGQDFYVGSRDGTGFFFQGRLYFLHASGSSQSDSVALAVEQYGAGRAKLVI
jgi:hypothetical protein